MGKLKGTPLSLPWDGVWPRIDPRLGLFLCESCWASARRHDCSKNGCGCPKRGCAGYITPTDPPAFTAEGQTSFPDVGVIVIGPKS